MTTVVGACLPKHLNQFESNISLVSISKNNLGPTDENGVANMNGRVIGIVFIASQFAELTVVKCTYRSLDFTS
jgi:hypothetical protein